MNHVQPCRSAGCFLASRLLLHHRWLFKSARLRPPLPLHHERHSPKDTGDPRICLSGQQRSSTCGPYKGREVMAGLLFNKAKDHLQRRLSRTVRRLRQDRSSERRKLQKQHGESCASTSTDARGNIWMPQACKILRAKFPASPTCMGNACAMGL